MRPLQPLFALLLVLLPAAACLSKGDTTVNQNTTNNNAAGAAGAADSDCAAFTCHDMCLKLSAETFKYCDKIPKGVENLSACESECMGHGDENDPTGIACVCAKTFRSCTTPGGADGSAFKACGDLL